MKLPVTLLGVDTDGGEWKEHFQATWPDFKRWFLSEGAAARPRYPECKRAIARHMPELEPVYDRVTAWAGGGDLAARFLSLWRPPPYMAGCTQAVWEGAGGPLLVRNYDYDARWFEGVVFRTDWLRPVIGVSDCAWGLLDGMNADGLVASLTFGGKRDVGEGFGIPLLIRYVLETCATVDAARAVFERIPVHMTYNVTLLDASGAHVQLHLTAGGGCEVGSGRVCTNHQADVEWPAYEQATATRERKAYLEDLLERPDLELPGLVSAFLQAPLHQSRFERSFGTLYTSCWTPRDGRLDLHWPTRHVTTTFDTFEARALSVQLAPLETP